MSRYKTPLAVALVALAAAACTSSDERYYPGPASNQGSVATGASRAPVVSYPYATPTVQRAAPAIIYQAPGPIVAPQPQMAYSPTRPMSQPVPSVLPASRPASVSAATPTSYVPANAPVSTPRATARPAARTEMERLNPGMPRLVESSNPQNSNFVARPRRKPSRALIATGERMADLTPRTGSGGYGTLAVPTTSSPSYTSSMSTPPMIEYNIPHIPQKEPLWCWAAAAQQAIGWVNNGRAPAQCAIVAMAHNIDVEACCNDVEGICARTGEIPAIAALVRKFGGQAAESTTVPRDPKEIYRILQGGSTLLIRLRPAPHDQAVGIRHMIVVRGIEWLRMPNGRLEATLLYNDPLGAGYRAVTFDEIVGFFEQALIVRRSS